MPSMVFLVVLVLAVVAVRLLRNRAKPKSARWCLWAAFFTALTAFQGGWVPSDGYTLPAMVAFSIWTIIQGVCIESDVRKGATH